MSTWIADNHVLYFICSDSQIMIGLDMGVDDFEQYYGYYTWYLNEVQISYTAIPSVCIIYGSSSLLFYISVSGVCL